MNTINSTNLSKNNTLQISKNNNNYNITSPIKGLKGDTVSFGAGLSRKSAAVLEESIQDVLHSGPFDIVAGTKFHKLLNRLMPEIMLEENYLNKGRESKVFRISDDYVAKIRRGKTDNNAIHFYNSTTRPNHQFNDIDIYYGEPLIKCGNVEILKNATPSQDFMYSGIKYSNKYRSCIGEIERYEQVFLPTCASLPQESFDELAKGLRDLNKIKAPYSKKFVESMRRGHFVRMQGCPFMESLSYMNLNPFKSQYYTPDVINPNNILISDGRFRIVDKMDVTPVENPNSLFTMIEPLLIRLTPDKCAEYKPELVEPRLQIFKKCLLAAEKWLLPLESGTKYEYSDFFFNGLFKNQKEKNIISTIGEMRNSNVSPYERAKYINANI